MHYTGIERNFPYTFIHLTCPEVFLESLRKLYSKLQRIAIYFCRKDEGQVEDYWPVLDPRNLTSYSSSVNKVYFHPISK